MPLNLLEGALGGIGLFLFGMRIMTDGIRAVANERIRSVFASITSNRLFSMLFGAALSVSLNSVSAAVIFSIGLLNGGVLNTFQSMNVLAGVLIGAALSLHLPLIPYSLVATPLIFLGVVMRYFSRRRRIASAGNLLLGAGLLFLGQSLLEASFRAFDSHPLYNVFEEDFFENPLLSVIFGGMISCFVQSSPSLATVVSSLVSTFYVSPEMASVMVLGGISGAALIGCLVSLGGTSASRLVSLSFFCINSALILLLTGVMHYLLDMEQVWKLAGIVSDTVEGERIIASLAWIYTFAALAAAFFLTLLSGLVARLIGAHDFAGPSGSQPQPCAGYLDTRIINTPALAIEQARKEVVRMAAVATNMYADTREILFDYDARRAETIRQHEQVLDSLNHEITSFLAALANNSNSREVGYMIPWLLQNVTDLEHLGDRCEDILDCIVARKEENVFFSDDAMDELRRLVTAVNTSIAMIEEVVSAGVPVDDVRAIKQSARSVFQEVKNRHFDRIGSGSCTPRGAILYNDIANAFEKIAELCWNIMQAQGRRVK